ncbi:MAG: prepilin-type N-terminal cleavage/methylation domain-containing protein [Candidatus Aminicenantales bacterium]
MSQKKRKHGFSLIELLISSALILFLITGTAQLLIFSLAAKRTADSHFTAVRRASSRLEELKSLPFDDEELEAGTHQEDIADPASPEKYRIAWRVEDIEENLKKIVLEVHPQGKPQRRTAFCLLLCRELEF